MCEVWGKSKQKNSHKIKYIKNNEGARGGMKISLSVLIFNHSEEKHNLTYEYFLDLGDGDSKTRQAVVECAFIRERIQFL